VDTPRVYRLTHAQWEASVQQLLDLEEPSGLSSTFVGDPLAGGFSNNADALKVGALLFQDYQRAAESLALELVVDPDRYARVVPQDEREGGIAFEAQLEAEDAEATTGQAYDEEYCLWSNGTLWVDVEVPSAGAYTVSAQVRGTDCGDGVGALTSLYVGEELLVDQVEVVSQQVLSASTTLGGGSHRVTLQFHNDCYDPDAGVDRNLWIDWIRVDGETSQSLSGEAEARAWIADFGQQAFRRPLTEDEIDAYLALFEQGPDVVDSGDAFSDGVRVVVQAMLQAPHFLYRIESGAAGRPLDGWEAAAKLSYTLWNAPPDEELLADVERLKQPEVLREHAERMVQDPRAYGPLVDFHAELFHVDDYVNITKDDEAFGAEMPDWMAQEFRAYSEEVFFTEGAGLSRFLTADYTVANGPLAALYGETGGDDFARIELDGSQRAGVLTQAGFLMAFAESEQSNPIRRGVFINEALLCTELPPPPDEATGLPPQEDGTNRDRVEAHTGLGTCGEGCHSTLINPPGFAFENYDGLGRWRDTDNGLPVDAADVLTLDGERVSFSDGVELAQAFASSSQVHACYAEHLVEYLHGRDVVDSDHKTVEIVAETSLAGGGLQELVVEAVTQETFRCLR